MFEDVKLPDGKVLIPGGAASNEIAAGLASKTMSIGE